MRRLNRALNFFTWSSLIRHLRQPLHLNLSVFSRVILGEECAQTGIERDQSSLVENTVPFDIRKFRNFKPVFLVEWNAPLKCCGMLLCNRSSTSFPERSTSLPRCELHGIALFQNHVTFFFCGGLKVALARIGRTNFKMAASG